MIAINNYYSNSENSNSFVCNPFEDYNNDCDASDANQADNGIAIMTILPNTQSFIAYTRRKLSQNVFSMINEL